MRQVIGFTLLLIFGLSVSTGAFGASAFKKALEQKKNIYIDKGTVIGGESGQAFSLLKVRSQADLKKAQERIVLNLGDERGQVLKGRMSFYQVNVEPESSRVVISLAQISQSQVSDADLQNLFKKSPFVSSARLIPDMESGRLSVELRLKRPVKVEVFQRTEKEKPGRLVIDLIARK